MSEWKTYKLDRVCKKITDGTHFSPKEMPDGKRIIATVRDMSEYGFAIQNCKRISEEDYLDAVKNGCRPEKGDVLFSKDGTMGIVQFFKGDVDLVLLSSIAILKPDIDIIDGEYLAYYLKNPQTNNFIKENFKSGSALPRIVLKDLKKFELHIPSTKNTQKKIASILSSLDDKIELNLQMNQTLEAMAQAIFKEWFVNFNFPGFDGELVDGLPKEWKMGKLHEISLNFDSKRVPLSSRERAEKQGVYPYYGAASILDYVEDYIFDGTYLLMGEDGTVVTSEGFPVLQYVWGKFWVNNHTHVLQGKAPFTTEYLFLLLSKTQITHIITGAVQPKINQGNMNKIECVIPTDDILEDFQNIILPLFEKRKTILDENKTLTQIRDSLLPKLMTGKISLNQDLQD